MSYNADLERGNHLLDIGRPAEAEAHIRKALAAEPENFSAHMMLALVFFKTNRADHAVKIAEMAIPLDPISDWPHRLLSYAHAECRRPNRKASLTHAQRAVELEPDVAGNHMALSEAHRLFGRKGRNAAVTAAQRGVELDPEDSDGFVTLGNACLSADRKYEAERNYRLALEIDSESAIARSNLAMILRESGRAEQALPLLRSNVMDAPSDSTNMDALLETADAHLKAGPVTKAMNTMFRWSLLRFPLVIALILFPFAKLEQRRRIATLAPDVQAARASQKGKDKAAGFDWRLILVILALVWLVVFVAGLLARLFG